MKTAQFFGNESAPARARALVALEIGLASAGGREPGEGDDVILVVSELVTNAVRAGASLVRVQIDIDPTQICVQVADDAAGWPTPRDPLHSEVQGRGLAIVEQLADSWSTTPLQRGKVVKASWSLSPGDSRLPARKGHDPSHLD
jgi:signal transduction histidine kinase